MDVDIYKLPIPDWDLQCPQCEYCLNGLTSHRCPECGIDLDMALIAAPHTRLRDPLFTGLESPLPDFGLQCTACREPLWGALESACPACGEPNDVPGRRPKDNWFRLEPWMSFGVPTEIVAMILDEQYVPYLAQQGYNALVIGSLELSVASEFFFDLLYFTRERAARSPSEDS